MTTLHDARGTVHYRQTADLSSVTPGNGVDGSLDVTQRSCVPCATIGKARQGAGWSDDRVPLCAGHVELYALSHVDREQLEAALAGFLRGLGGGK